MTPPLPPLHGINLQSHYLFTWRQRKNLPMPITRMRPILVSLAMFLCIYALKTACMHCIFARSALCTGYYDLYTLLQVTTKATFCMRACTHQTVPSLFSWNKRSTWWLGCDRESFFLVFSPKPAASCVRPRSEQSSCIRSQALWTVASSLPRTGTGVQLKLKKCDFLK